MRGALILSGVRYPVRVQFRIPRHFGQIIHALLSPNYMQINGENSCL